MEDCSCGCQKRSSERSKEELTGLQNRINRIIGQLNGISKMLDENRYCGEVLNQVAAVNNAIRSLAYLILQTHMDTCVKEEVLSGKDTAMDDLLQIIKKLG